MLDSNAIEGEMRLNPGDLAAVYYVVDFGILREEDLLAVHSIIGEYLKQDWVGKYRTCKVYVGEHMPPNPQEVPRLMKRFFETLPNMTAWQAHNEFEWIHPFQDLNGRAGRLIWLSKAVKTGYNFKLTFLHTYYYQTLKELRSSISLDF